MTDAQLRRLSKQLRAGADGYKTLRRAVEKSHIGDQPALARAIENMRRLEQELEELACFHEFPNDRRDAPAWIREVKL